MFQENVVPMEGKNAGLLQKGGAQRVPLKPNNAITTTVKAGDAAKTQVNYTTRHVQRIVILCMGSLIVT